MKTKLAQNLILLATVVMLLAACAAPATTDPAAIATSAVQTVEARYTQQAQELPSTTPAPAASATPTTAPVVTPATSTPQPLDSNGKACYTAIFLADVTIPDGKLMAPGEAFTKQWRIQNAGNCTWDSNYALVLDGGDAMGGAARIPLTVSVGPGESAVLAVDLVAPTVNGMYTGYWRILTPFGGTFGVGIQDQSMIVQIEVTDKPKRDEDVSVIDIGLYQRVPAVGCNSKGAVYTISAVVTANTAVEVTYHWIRNPTDDSKPEGGRLKFTEAGSKSISFTWTLQKEAIQDIDRWVALQIDKPSVQVSERVHFTFTCQQ